MANHTHMRLGRRAPKHDRRNLQLAQYLKLNALPTPPDSVDWSTKCSSNWGMLLNDTLGDCTCAGAGHMIMCWTGNNGTEITVTNDQTLAAYEGACGYKSGDPSTDQGGVETEVLDYWRQNGIAGTKIDAYVALEPQNDIHVKSSIDLFGGVYTGFALPESAQTQDIWSVVTGYRGSPGSWGGHAIPIIAYDSNYLTCITWGQLKKMTWGFWNTYCDESYAIISSMWAKGNQLSPAGFDYATLKADLALVTG